MFFVADFYFGQISVVLEIFRESKKKIRLRPELTIYCKTSSFERAILPKGVF